MTRFPASFVTSRLLLRPIVASDADTAFREYAADPIVTRYLTWHPYTDPDACSAFFSMHAQRHQAGELGAYAITLRNVGQMIGAFDLRPDAAHRVNFGYVLARDYWHQGLMTEALNEVVRWALSQPEIWRIWAVTDTENRASARVMEKAGLLREGVLRRWMLHPNISPTPRDCFCYARVR